MRVENMLFKIYHLISPNYIVVDNRQINYICFILQAHDARRQNIEII